MALKTQQIVDGLGSQEVAQLVRSYNALLVTLDTLITGLKTAADAAAINVLATAAELTLQANSYKLALSPSVPMSPAAPPV